MKMDSDVSFSLVSLFHLGNHIHSFNKKSEKKWGISLMQWVTLSHLLDNPGCSPQKLAVAVGVHPSSLTQTLKRLEKKGFLFVAEDPKDSRKKIISITRSGKERLDEAIEAINREATDFKELKKPLLTIQKVLEMKTR